MKIRNLECDPEDAVSRELLSTSSQRSKTLPILEPDLRRAIDKSDIGEEALRDLSMNSSNPNVPINAWKKIY